jgi:copper chaperone CopZ
MTRLSKYGTLSLRHASLLYRAIEKVYGVYVYLPKDTDCFLDLKTILSKYGTQRHGSVFIL